jgi:cold-inducible RNA-binding protein
MSLATTHDGLADQPQYRERKSIEMANKSLYVGNLTYDTTSQDLCTLFADYTPGDCRVIPDRGFGFVEVPDDKVQEAIEAMNGKDFRGRALTVNEARPRTEGGGGRSGGGGYGGGGRSGGGGYGGGGGRSGGGRSGGGRSSGGGGGYYGKSSDR